MKYSTQIRPHDRETQDQFRPGPVPALEVCARMGRWSLVGRRDLDRYVAVPHERVPLLQKAAKGMDGSRGLAEVAAIAGTSEAQVLHFHQEMLRAGLVEGSRPPSPLGRLALCLWTWQLPGISPAIRRYISGLFLPLAILTSALIAAGIALAFVQPSILTISPPISSVNGWPSLGELLVVFAVAVSAHEVGHMIAAARYGIFPRNIQLIAYLGVLPFLLLRLPGLYLLPRRQRLVVWIAGIWLNLSLWAVASLVGAMLSPAFGKEIASRLAITNLTLAVINILPFLPTDGYLAMSTLVGQPNLRRRSRKEIQKLLSGEKVRSSLLVLYGLVSTAFTLVLVERNLRACYSIALAIGIWPFLGSALIALAALGAKQMGVFAHEK